MNSFTAQLPKTVSSDFLTLSSPVVSNGYTPKQVILV